jgi:hypothetical protein
MPLRDGFGNNISAGERVPGRKRPDNPVILGRGEGLPGQTIRQVGAKRLAGGDHKGRVEAEHGSHRHSAE